MAFYAGEDIIVNWFCIQG